MEKERIIESVRKVTELSYPACYLRADVLRAAGRLIPHERLRNESKLTVLDTREKLSKFKEEEGAVLVFVSHQWLGSSEPDPSNVHWSSIVNALAHMRVELGVPEEKIFVWTDYYSIPQENSTVKGLAISSLPAYAAAADYFLIVAPPCTHADTGAACDLESYQRRGWCRLEQWSAIASDHMDCIRIANSAGDVPPRRPDESEASDWWLQAIHVFDGDFSAPADKSALVEPVLGLWALALHLRVSEQRAEHVCSLVDQCKASVFPNAYFGSLVDRLEAIIGSAEYQQGLAGPFSRVRTAPPIASKQGSLARRSRVSAVQPRVSSAQQVIQRTRNLTGLLKRSATPVNLWADGHGSGDHKTAAARIRTNVRQTVEGVTGRSGDASAAGSGRSLSRPRSERNLVGSRPRSWRHGGATSARVESAPEEQLQPGSEEGSAHRGCASVSLSDQSLP
mmetsp:Transcript_25284/g.65317  ORF Transcript_25284/g.65317 Transcript_25284/m.65317 type:complete len:451 (+) Transcript_25284:1-1353(+)